MLIPSKMLTKMLTMSTFENTQQFLLLTTTTTLEDAHGRRNDQAEETRLWVVGKKDA